MMDLRENGFPFPTAGHFVNVKLEKYEVKPSFGGKFAQSHSLLMIRVVQHAHLLSVYFAISVSRKHRALPRTSNFSNNKNRGADVSASCVDGEPDVEALFRQQFLRDPRAQRFVMDVAASASDARVCEEILYRGLLGRLASSRCPSLPGGSSTFRGIRRTRRHAGN
jgi:hypothetical protein